MCDGNMSSLPIFLWELPFCARSSPSTVLVISEAVERDAGVDVGQNGCGDPWEATRGRMAGRREQRAETKPLFPRAAR